MYFIGIEFAPYGLPSSHDHDTQLHSDCCFGLVCLIWFGCSGHGHLGSLASGSSKAVDVSPARSLFGSEENGGFGLLYGNHWVFSGCIGRRSSGCTVLCPSYGSNIAQGVLVLAISRIGIRLIVCTRRTGRTGRDSNNCSRLLTVSLELLPLLSLRDTQREPCLLRPVFLYNINIRPPLESARVSRFYSVHLLGFRRRQPVGQIPPRATLRSAPRNPVSGPFHPPTCCLSSCSHFPWPMKARENKQVMLLLDSGLYKMGGSVNTSAHVCSNSVPLAPSTFGSNKCFSSGGQRQTGNKGGEGVNLSVTGDCDVIVR
ncbi:hypothetical protein N657DRAFT_210599 [Parathielavia appendiculata]|uniref:Uncharacterized protein n=1 Tax=Parathielavia appendiculata TaxID=2587402 RepID=A0AAN6U6N6_9PEZI|nr:hypothetical protein N657DRAFT_210599 [Parathielavia appendiculata]